MEGGEWLLQIFHEKSYRVWGRAGIKFTTPGSAIRLTTDCAMGPALLGDKTPYYLLNYFFISKKIECYVQSAFLVKDKC